MEQVFKNKRHEKKLRLSDLANSIGVTRQRISKFEKGEDVLTFREIVALCRELDFRLTVSDERSTFDCK